MAKAKKTPKKKAAKKSAAKTKPAKKTGAKKAIPKKVKPPKKAVARKQPEGDLGETMPSSIEPPTLKGNCICVEMNGLFFCMRTMANGDLRKCPGQPPFMTRAECEAESC